MKPSNQSAAVPAPRVRERGAALFIALIALIFMVLGGLALVRSVDTANVISGNFAFKQGALQNSDIGVEAAFTLLNDTIVATSTDANYPAGCNTAAPTSCRYFALERPDADGDGVPDVIGNWSNVPSTTLANGYSYQFVIDRLCSEQTVGSTTVTDLTKYCYAGQQTGGGSKRAGATVFTSSQEVYYRTTIRVTGPRNTSTIVQTLLAR